MRSLSEAERNRYQRQMIIPEIGETGQKRLKDATVFIGGLGGLGSVLSTYMAAAGVGRLRLADSDHVEVSNLNRQILHTTPDLNLAKTASAAAKINALNPHVKVEIFQTELGGDNIAELVSGSDIILDGTDNLATRRVLNRGSILKGIPLIYGGIDGFSGMVSSFIPGKTPCFECLFPGDSEVRGPIGALGPMAGLVATTQCLEALKLLMDIPGGLTGSLLYIDAQEMSFKKIPLERNPDCETCAAAWSE